MHKQNIPHKKSMRPLTSLYLPVGEECVSPRTHYRSLLGIGIVAVVTVVALSVVAILAIDDNGGGAGSTPTTTTPPTLPPSPTMPPTPAPVEVFVFVGQSNQAGINNRVANKCLLGTSFVYDTMAVNTPLIESTLQPTQALPNSLIWDGTAFVELTPDTDNCGQGPASKYDECVRISSDELGCGPILNFAYNMNAHSASPRYYFNWAKRGTSMAQWIEQNNDIMTYTATAWDSALASLELLHPNDEIQIKAFLWLQGEHDAKNGISVTNNDYEAATATLVTRLRALPKADAQTLFVDAGISTTTSHSSTVNGDKEAHAQLDPHSEYVGPFSTATLDSIGDNIHYSGTGSAYIGQVFANTYIASIPGAPTSTPPPTHPPSAPTVPPLEWRTSEPFPHATTCVDTTRITTGASKVTTPPTSGTIIGSSVLSGFSACNTACSGDTDCIGYLLRYKDPSGRRGCYKLREKAGSCQSPYLECASFGTYNNPTQDACGGSGVNDPTQHSPGYVFVKFS